MKIYFFANNEKTLIMWQGYTEDEATHRAEKIFHSLDINGDGNLEEDEFVKVGLGKPQKTYFF